MNLILIISALTPVLLLFCYILEKDMRQPEPLKWLIKALFYGVGAGLLVILTLSGVPRIEVTGWPTAFANAFLMAAIPEESAKLLMLWLLLRKNPYYDERLDGIVYAGCIGLGFAGLENIGYLVSSYMEGGNWLSTGITRAIFAVPGHFFFGVIMGFFYALASFSSPRKRLYNLFLAWAMPILAHGLYDAVLMGMGTTSAALSGWLMLLFIIAFNRLRKYSVSLIKKHQEKDRANNNLLIVISLPWILLMPSCSPSTTSPRGSFAKGADVSWLSEMEHDSVLFYDTAGRQGDCMDIMQNMGMNAIRLRVWVNHTTGWSNKEDVIQMASRASKKGLRVLIDFHYSDFFADPSHQTIPEDWKDYNFDSLCLAVREHTLDVLSALKNAGIEPEWVQIGNETPNGMLWPIGRVMDRSVESDTVAEPITDNWDEYATLTTMGHQAAKEVFPDITTIVHVDNAFIYRDWFFRALEEHGGQFDMIGLSHYPMMSEWSGISWQESNQRAQENIIRLIREFHRPVLVAEVGVLNGEGMMDNGQWQAVGYDSIASLSGRVMADFIERIIPVDSCAGVFYWEPQCYGGWRPAEYIPLGWGGYQMGSFTPDGKPSPALHALFEADKE